MLASLIATFLSGEALDAVRRARATAIIYVVVAMLALTGIGFLIGAAYIAIARRYGNFEAALAFGIAFILIAVLVLLVRRIAMSIRRSRRKRRAVDLATIAGTAAVTALPLLLRSRAGLIAPLIALAAYVIYRENWKDRPGDDPKGDE
jgi:hypothetical protein